MSITTNTSKKSIFDGRNLWFIFAAGCAVVAALIAFAILSAATAKDSYYVLNTDVTARTEISISMLTQIQTSAGSVPPSALSISDINSTRTFSLYSLKRGDILTKSNTGDLLSLSAGLPSNFVIGSFVAAPSMAAGGNIQRGDYVDIMAIVNDNTVTGSSGAAASYILQRVLVIDATVNLDSYSSNSSASSTTTGNGTSTNNSNSGNAPVSSNTKNSAIRAGVPTLFTVGLSPQDATVLAVASKFELYVVLSSADSVNKGIVPTNLSPASGGSIWGNPRNAGKGTDNTFGQGGSVVVGPNDNSTNAPSTPTPKAPSSPSPTPGTTGTPSPSPTPSG